jgi:microcystin-dependent protein
VGLLAATDKAIGVKQGDYRGRENLVLQTDNLAEHAHAVSVYPAGSITVAIPISASTDAQIEPTTTFSYLSQSNASAAAALWTDKTDPVAIIQGVVGTMDAIPGKLALESSGKGATVSIVPPQLGMTYCIATQGSFPAID